VPAVAGQDASAAGGQGSGERARVACQREQWGRGVCGRPCSAVPGRGVGAGGIACAPLVSGVWGHMRGRRWGVGRTRGPAAEAEKASRAEARARARLAKAIAESSKGARGRGGRGGRGRKEGRLKKKGKGALKGEEKAEGEEGGEERGRGRMGG